MSSDQAVDHRNIPDDGPFRMAGVNTALVSSYPVDHAEGRVEKRKAASPVEFAFPEVEKRRETSTP